MRQGVEVVATHARPKKYVALVDDAGLNDAMPHQASFGFTAALKARLEFSPVFFGTSRIRGANTDRKNARRCGFGRSPHSVTQASNYID